MASVPVAPEIVDPAVGADELGRLADIVRRRGVRRIAYFHCDHFEPWRTAPGSRSIEENAEDVLRFAEQSATNEFARRLTLFYKAHVPVTRSGSLSALERAGGDDVFGFVDRTPHQEGVFRDAIQGLLARVDHEFQVHVHHEHFTSNSGHRDPELIALFADPAMACRDEERVEIALRRSLAAIRAETGQALDRWFFVHGVWALNASDPSACNVTNEIAMLMRHGGLGDFTFPAGRPDVDPFHREPFFVRPLDAPRAYDLAEADPQRGWGNGAAARDGRFFIWASPIRHFGSSVDYYSGWLDEKLAEPARFAEEILSQSVVAGDTLWFKTHGHSMHAKYCAQGRETVFPHQYPPLVRMMGTVFDAGAAAGAEIAFLTASEVYDEFVGAPAPDGGPVRLAARRQLSGVRNVAEVERCAARLNEAGAAFVMERVAQDGENAPGIGAYYAARAQKGAVLAPYEARIAELVLDYEDIRTVYEVGCGLNALGMLMAMLGLQGIGIERDLARVGAARDLQDAVGEALGIDPEQCEIWGNAAPGALRGVDGRGAAIVFTNITSSIQPDDLEQIIALASQFDLAVVDASRFFVARTALEQQMLLDRLVDAGWKDPAPLTGSYWWFRRPQGKV